MGIYRFHAKIGTHKYGNKNIDIIEICKFCLNDVFYVVVLYTYLREEKEIIVICAVWLSF
jgi:hypothetical protein